AEQALLNLSEKRMRGGFVSVKDMELPATRLLEKLYTEREMITGVATGFRDIDRLTSGLQPGDLVILAARPSMGKTALCLNIAQYVALHKNLPVGMFSLEMSKEQLLMRMLCAEARVNAHKVRKGYLGKDDFRKLIDALGRTTQAPMYIDDSSTLTVMEMRAKCRRLKAERGLGVVMVDYLQLMSSYGRVENRTQEISGLAELIIAKQRSGPTGIVKLAFLREFTRFETLLVDLQ